MPGYVAFLLGFVVGALAAVTVLGVYGLMRNEIELRRERDALRRAAWKP